MAKTNTKKKPNWKKKRRKWTALIYIAGDNDLSDEGLKDLREICESRSADSDSQFYRPSSYVGVEMDTRGEHDGSIRYDIDDDGLATVVQRLGEGDTGDPGRLVEFLRWGLARFPADRHLGVVWGHGEGFKSHRHNAAALGLRRGVAYDETGGALAIPEIAQALARVGAAKRTDRRVEVLGFDACLMSMVEVAHRLRDHVKYLVGSQQTEPADGWPYGQVLRCLKLCTRGKSPGKKLGTMIVDLYVQRYEREKIPNVTHSCIDLDYIAPVMCAVGKFAKALTPLVMNSRDLIEIARGRTQSFDMPDYIDLLDFCDRLERVFTVVPPDLAAAIAQIRSTAKDSIVHTRTYGDAVKRAKGLTFWFPTIPVVYQKFRAKYRTLAAELCENKCCNEYLMPGDVCKCGTKQPEREGLLTWVDFLDHYHYLQPTVMVLNSRTLARGGRRGAIAGPQLRSPAATIVDQ